MSLKIAGTIAQNMQSISDGQYQWNAVCNVCGTKVMWNGDENSVNVCPSVRCVMQAQAAEAVAILKRIESTLTSWDGDLGDVPDDDPDDHEIMQALRRVEHMVKSPAVMCHRKLMERAAALAKGEVGNLDLTKPMTEVMAYAARFDAARAKHMEALTRDAATA